MKLKIGDIVASEFGEGPIVAMTPQWCIHEDHGSPPPYPEFALAWNDVHLVFQVPDKPEGGVQELEIDLEEGK